MIQEDQTPNAVRKVRLPVCQMNWCKHSVFRASRVTFFLMLEIKPNASLVFSKLYTQPQSLLCSTCTKLQEKAMQAFKTKTNHVSFGTNPEEQTAMFQCWLKESTQENNFGV